MTFDRLLPSLARRAASIIALGVAPLLLGLAVSGMAHAQLVVTGVPGRPDPVAAGRTLPYTVVIGDARCAARSTVSLDLDIPRGGRYAATGTLPGGVSRGGMALDHTGPGTIACAGIDVDAIDIGPVAL